MSTRNYGMYNRKLFSIKVRFFRILCLMVRFVFFLFLSFSLFSGEIKDKVLICGVCRNVEPALANTIQSIEELGSHFLDYRVIIYENNSHDKTKKILKKWSQRNSKVLFLSEHVSKKQFAAELAMKRKNRTEVIAWARNRVLDIAMDPKFDDYKYVIWADLDFKAPWDVEHIVETILHPEQEWDAVLAYGSYDLFAFRDERCPIGHELIGSLYWSRLGEFAKEFAMEKEDPWRKVYSAFGGLGIYQRRSIQGCRYSGVITQDLEKLMVLWLDKARRSEYFIPLLKEYEEMLAHTPVIDLKKCCLANREKIPDLIGMRLYNQQGSGRVVYFSCTHDATLPWTCEHIPFHATMILNGRDKIFVNPKIRSNP